MNSKQINFFITHQDIAKINTFFSDKHCFILKRKVKKGEFFLEYDIVKNEQNIFQVCLSKNEYKKKVYYEELDSKEYYINILKSYCVEFSIGGFYPYSNKELHQSRFYFATGYYADEVKVRKNTQFLTWAEDIIKSFKEQFLIKTIAYPGFYFSENCLKWINENHAKNTTDGSKFII